MLIDDVRECLRTGYLSVMPDAEEVLSRIAEARCYVLDDDVTRAAAHLSFMRPSNMVRNMGFARTPAPVTWIEYPAPMRDAVESSEFGLGLREGAVACEKVGALIRQEGDGRDPADLVFRAEIYWRMRREDAVEPSRIGVATHELVWTLADPTEDTIEDMRRQCAGVVNGANAAIKRKLHLGDPAEIEAQIRLSAHFLCQVRPVIRRNLMQVSSDEISRATSTAEANAILKSVEAATDDISDAMHEAPFIVSTLLLLNASNAVETRDSDLHKLNRSRQRSGKEALKDHAVLAMRLTKVQANRMAARGITGETRRFHWAEGHLKRVERRVLDERGRPTGEKQEKLVWWADQWRGDPSKGIVPNKTRIVRI